MNLILCASNTGLRQRWAAALEPAFVVYQASSLEDLRILVRQQIAFELLLVHHLLVEPGAIDYIRSRLPACRLVVLSDRPGDHEGMDCIRRGVVGYANSYISPERLLEMARVVAGGAVWINQRLMQRLIEGMATGPAAPTASVAAAKKNGTLTSLSDREYQIAHLVAEGLANQSIADQLGITERTVKAHLGAIYAKTATRGRLGLALLINQQQRA